MESKLEKLFSNVLVTWLLLKTSAEAAGAPEPDKQKFKFAAVQFEQCMRDAGFDTDMRDFQKELSDIVA